MSRHRKLVLHIAALAFVFAILAQVAFAGAWPVLSPEDAKKIMPVSEVKRGMRGYGLTVFHGTKIEKFDVEILGVLKKMNTGRDLIMVRVGGGPITTRSTGIIGGMSGSPIYVNGKLLGAVSYGASFAKEPVGMVTPIADMLEAWDQGLPKQASGYSSPQTLSQKMSIGGKSVGKVQIDPPGSQPRGIDNGTIYMQPLMTTMMVSGMSQRGIDRLADILAPFGIRPMAGPGGGSDPDSKVKVNLEPGSAVGMSLASGDIDMTGIGTVTYRRGDKVVAFGHPMLGIGAIDAPMTTAYITDVISSYQVSTKLGASLQTVGHIFQDRPWCIAGSMGAPPKTIPITISIDDKALGRDRVYHIKVINHPLLAARLVAMVTDEAIFNMHSTPGDATAAVSYDVTADQIGKITRSNIFFDPTAIDMPATMDMASLLGLLSTNKFHPLDIRSVNVRVQILGKRNTATIDRIFVKKSEFQPGETVDVGVVLRPYKQERVTKTFQIKIPATATDGKIALMVRGGGTPMGMMIPGASPDVSSDSPDAEPAAGAAPGIMIDPGMAYADNVKQLVDKFLERDKNNEVVLQLQMRGTAINVGGEKLTGMPSAIADVMKSSRNSGLRMEREEVKAVYPNESIIYGAARLMIDVKRKSLKEGKPAPKGGLSSDSIDISSDPSLSSSGSDTSSLDSMDYGDELGSSATKTSTELKAPPAPPAPTKDQVTKEKPLTVEKDSLDDSTDDTPAPSLDSKPATPSASPKSNVKTVVRQAASWSQKTQADFAKGTFAGVSATSENKLELAPTLKKLTETPEQFVWCVAAAKDGGVYAGTGNSGKIYRVSRTGESKVFYETGELEVHSIVRDSAGNVYAGTSPHGKIFKISPDGKGKVLYAASERYILALALDPDGNLYAGVGDAGKVYRITPNGSAMPFVTVSEQQVLSLAWDPHGSLLIGTGINGVVYRATRSGNASPIFDATENSITSVVSDGDGNAYVGTSPKGAIYKISPDGRSKTIYPKADRVLSMVCDSKNNVYAVSDGTLVKITPDDTVVQLDSSQEKVQFLSLALNEEASELYASTGNIGSVYVSKCCDIRGTYESPVHDTKMVSKWGRVKWIADTPEGTGVEVRTRTGNVESPDTTWTDWSAAYKTTGEQISGAPGRYIQYQVTLTTGKADVSPKVATVTLSYLTPNQAPTVKLTAPAGGEVWAGKETIKWMGSDPDKDTLSYDVFYSKDAGKTWKALVGGNSGAKAVTAETKTATEINAKVDAELGKSKDVPEDMKAKITAGAAPEAKPSDASKPAVKSSTNTSYTWDTATADDGTYVVKVVASDKASNANDPLTDSIISEPFTVCNKAPEIQMGRKTIQMKGAASATITGTATSKLVEIAGVQYRVDGGDWAAASANSGMFDSPTAEFTITTPSLATGSHKVEVQAIDAAGNAASTTVEVKVS